MLGKRGSGKTTLALKACSFRAHGLIIDTLGDIRSGSPIQYSELHRLHEWRRMDVPREAERLGVGIDNLAGCTFTAVVRLARAKLLPCPFTLFVDEADSYGSAAWNNEALREAARYGRHWGIQYIITARRYAEIPKDWTANADLVLMGPSLDPADADVVKRIAGPYARNWAIIQQPYFLGISLDGPALYVYNSIDRTIEAESL